MQEKFESVLKKTVNPGKCRESLVGNEYLSDVILKLGVGEEELRAHKFFLITASPVFHKIFINNQESGENAIEMKITAIEKPIMMEICRFAYSEIVHLTKDNMLDVLFAASRFEMKFLVEKTVDFICKEGMTVDSVFKILKLNQKEQNLRISMKCFDFIKKNHKNCFQSQEFQTLPMDLLRTILQTCKIPATAAVQAVTEWSAYPDNIGEDLDELLALISLNDNVADDEVDADQVARDSDTESVSSRVSSRAGPRNDGRPRRNRRAQNSRNPTNIGNNQVNPIFRAPKVDFNLKPGMKLFSLAGVDTRKSFKFSNLNVNVHEQSILIHEFRFVYDVSTTDREFMIKIEDVTAKSSPLFFMQVSTSEKTNGYFVRYVLPRPCYVPKKSRIWISIEFMKGEFRPSRDCVSEAGNSGNGQLSLPNRPVAGGKPSSSGQIIAGIVFSDAPSD